MSDLLVAGTGEEMKEQNLRHESEKNTTHPS